MTATALIAPCTHSRQNTGLLAGMERRALVWLARRLPAAITSDHLSGLGLAAMFSAGLSFALFQLTSWAVVGVVSSLAANWFGDSLDGTVARVRDQQRPRYGYYVDHVIDIAGATFLFGGLACSGLMNPIIAALLLAAFLLVSAETYLATYARGVFQLSFFGFGPTELRILLAAGAIRAALDPVVTLGVLGTVRLFDVAGVVGIAGLSIVFVVSAIRNTRALYRAEPLPPRRNGTDI
jgi:phosphatidylglycerophosphate synthase